VKSPTLRNRIYIFFIILVALTFLPKLFVADSTLYTRFLTERALIYIGSLTKLLFLFLGFFFASRAAGRFEAENPVQSAWRFLGWGFLSYFVAQSILAVYQFVLHIAAPFPSFGDFFFLLAMLLWLISLGLFVRAYTQAGFLEGGTKRFVFVAVVGTLLLVGLGYSVLIPVLETQASIGEKALNIAYPVSDIVLLIPVLVLLQMAFKLSGGQLWRVWMGLLLGFVFLTVGDIAFAYFSILDQAYLDPLIDVLYAFSYIFASWGAAYQYDLLSC
jgi:hypothetical protein